MVFDLENVDNNSLLPQIMMKLDVIAGKFTSWKTDLFKQISRIQKELNNLQVFD